MHPGERARYNAAVGFVLLICYVRRWAIFFNLFASLSIIIFISMLLAKIYQVSSSRPNTMVLTAGQTTAFLENANQMALPHRTVLQLQHEGILTVGDLQDFDKECLSQIAETLRRPGGRIPDPNIGAVVGTTIPTPPFVFGAKSQMRLRVACDLIRYYITTSRPLTAANIQWDPVMSRFKELWSALKDRRKAKDPETPKISKGLPIIRWVEPFFDHLHQ